MKNLTNKQKKFITEYIKSLNAELSAKNAGYKSTDLNRTVEKLLSNNSVIYEIKNKIKKHMSSFRINKGYVVQKLLEIAEFSLEEEEILDKEGSYTGKKKLRDAATGLKSLEYLCKYLGFNTKPDDNLDYGSKIITIKNLDDEKI